MKVLAVILISFVGFVLSIKEHDLHEEWSRFQVKYGKSYISLVEARKRLAIFNDNLDRIRAHNALFELGETTFTKGINKFTDWSQDEFMQYLKRGLPEKPSTNIGKPFKKTEGFKFPEFVDWREKGAVRDVKNQESCGSCWSFSTTGALEGQFSIEKNQFVSLSEQNLVDCDEVSLGCIGGWPADALEYVKQNGIESEEDYPYTGKEGTCKSERSKTFNISGYEEIPEGDEEALQEERVQYQYVCTLQIISTTIAQAFSQKFPALTMT